MKSYRLYFIPLLVAIAMACGAQKPGGVDVQSGVKKVLRSSHGESNHVSWESEVEWSSDSDTLVIKTFATLEEGWHLYSQELESDEGPLPTIFSFEDSEAVKLPSKVGEEKPKEEYDENFGMNVRYFEGKTTFTQIATRKSDEAFSITGNVNYMVCNDEMCLPPVDVPLKIAVGKR